MSEDQVNNGSSAIGFFLVGLGIGAAVALLLAPHTGEETREMLLEKAEEGRDFVKMRRDEIYQQAGDAIEKGRDLVNKQKDVLSAALEAGKQAYQEEKSRAKQSA
jgi:gas vesicle protein